MRDFFANIFYKSSEKPQEEEEIFKFNTGMTPSPPRPSVPPPPFIPTPLLPMSLLDVEKSLPSSSTDSQRSPQKLYKSARRKVYDGIIETYLKKFEKYFGVIKDKPVTYVLEVEELKFKIKINPLMYDDFSPGWRFYALEIQVPSTGDWDDIFRRHVTRNLRVYTEKDEKITFENIIKNFKNRIDELESLIEKRR